MGFYASEPSVVLADGQHFFREGLRGVLETAGARVLGEAATAQQAATLASSLEPDVIVLDLDLPGISDGGLGQIATAAPKTRLIALSMSCDPDTALRTLGEGVSGYLLKDTGAEELVAAICALAHDQVLISRQIAQALVQAAGKARCAGAQPEDDCKSPELTPREHEVLRLIVAGADNGTIGEQLSISRHTVKQYVTNIFEKLGVDGRVAAAVYAVRQGLH